MVTFPMLPEARIASVKSHATARWLPSVREFERWLTRDAKLTRGEARTIIARGFTALARERDAAPHTPEGLTERLRKAARLIQQKEHQK